MMLDHDHLKTFLTIAGNGSFTRTAGEVNKTQSAVSMQMRRLEEMLGTRLFERDGRSSRLTHDGERLIDFARRIVLLNEETVRQFSHEKLAGHVRIGTPDEYAERYLPRILGGFARTNPQLDIEIRCAPSELLIEGIGRGELDLAIVTKDLGSVGGSVICAEQLLWIESERHPQHNEDVLPLALGPLNCRWRKAALAALDKAERRYRIAFSSHSRTGIAAAVLSGLAIGLLPESGIRPGMRVLTDVQGLPRLPECQIELIRSEGPDQPHVAALANHVLTSLTTRRLEERDNTIDPFIAAL